MQPSLIGEYGRWASQIVGSNPGEFSLRSGRFPGVQQWREEAARRVMERLAAPRMPEKPAPRVDWSGTMDDLRVELISWQLPWGPRTEAVYLRPASSKESQPLPGVLALHDHGGNK
ncbi:MAG TPA: hypothetical protein VGS41_00040, partial [Chthonomonadales bacterium]|nr:hypothetical protein [Chthonomonadales bacterium]